MEDTDISLIQYSLVKYPVSLWQMFISSLVTLLDSYNFIEDFKIQIQNYAKKATKQFLNEVNQKPAEAKLRMFLKFLQSIVSKTGPSLDILSELWKYFSQPSAINSSCRLKTMTLDGTTSIPSSSTSWLELITTISDYNDPSSFIMFVQLCSSSLASWSNNVETGSIPKEVKVLMGRISVKINPAKLSQLNEYGAFHLTTLLLSIAFHCSEDLTPQQIAAQLLKVDNQRYISCFQYFSILCFFPGLS